MTKTDAIDVLKRNYPASCFEDLCEAVDIAIKALSADTDYFEFTERLYKEAYERGKAEAQREYVNGYAKEYTIEQMNQARYIGFIEGEESAQRWIPVTERLPEDDRAVLVYEATYNNNFTATYEDGRWKSFDICHDDVYFDETIYWNVTKWMPLPYEPWKGEEE